jgi:2-phosphosulfolactate phosphatase
MSRGSVVIDCFPSSVARYADDHAVVAIDVIRATTFAVTAVAAGRRCLVATDLDDALEIRKRIPDAILAGELGGIRPDAFDMNNSPDELDRRTDIDRPLVMLSSSGTQLMVEAAKSPHGAYAACFRNVRAVADHLIGRHPRIAVIGAGSRNEFREEDQMGCAWLARHLIEAGYLAETTATSNLVERWKEAPAAACEVSNSVAYLRRSDQLADFQFVIDHVNDLDLVARVDGNEVVALRGGDAAVEQDLAAG